MSHEPTQNKIDRAKALSERNDKEKAFRKDQEKQAQRDQLVMPVDDVSNKQLEINEEIEDNKRESYGKDFN
ncbi:MAG TPA: hypothetical protein VIG80_16075 [Bacillaceae bacterium]